EKLGRQGVRCPASVKERLRGAARPTLGRQFGMRHPPRTQLLLNQIGQQPQKARPLDCARKFTLLLGRNRRDAARHDLAALRNITLQQLHVLIVDLWRLIAGERAGLAPTVEGTARRALRHAHQSSSPPSAAPRSMLSLPNCDSLGPKSRSRSRSRRGPRRSPRSPRSNLSPRSPRPSRSSRSARRIRDEGPCSCSSTLTVRKRMTSVERRIWRSSSATACGGASMFNSEKCALRFFLMRKVRPLSPQYSVLPTLPPPPSMMLRKSCTRPSTCCAEMSWRARNTCSKSGMDCLSFVSSSGAKPLMGP